MDWFTILLIFVFFILPLIQQVLEAKKRGPTPPPEIEGEVEAEEWVRLEEAPARGRDGEPVPASGSGGWSEGWGSWPGSTDGEAMDPSVPPSIRREVEEDRLPRRGVEESPAARREFEESRPPPRVEWHDPAPLPESEVQPGRFEPVSLPMPARRVRPPPPVQRTGADNVLLGRPARGPVPSVIRRRATAAKGLANPAELRQAIILSEILGKPVGLRHEDPSGPA